VTAVEILHLVDSAAGLQCAGPLLDHVMDGSPACDHDVVVLGGSRGVGFGLVNGEATVIPVRSTTRMVRDLLRLLGSRRPDHVVAWSPAAAIVGCGIVSQERLFGIALATEAGEPGLSLITPRRWATISSDVAAMIRHQTSVEIVVVQPPHVAAESASPRERLRSSWGIDEDVLAIGVLADVPSWCSIHGARETVIRLDTVGIPCCLIFDGESRDAKAESAPLVRGGLGRLLRPIDSGWSTAALSALDIAIVGDGSHPLGCAGPRWARSRAGMMGLPVVAPATTICDDGATEFTPGDLDSLSRAVLSVIDAGTHGPGSVAWTSSPATSLAAWVYREVLDGA
jgi:ethanolamine utilization microcompartment shell protein EutS